MSKYKWIERFNLLTDELKEKLPKLLPEEVTYIREEYKLINELEDEEDENLFLDMIYEQRFFKQFHNEHNGKFTIGYDDGTTEELTF